MRSSEWVCSHESEVGKGQMHNSEIGGNNVAGTRLALLEGGFAVCIGVQVVEAKGSSWSELLREGW